MRSVPTRPSSYLEEGHDLLLPLQPLHLHVPVGVRVGGLAVPDVRLAALHAHAQVVTNHLKRKKEEEEKEDHG